MNTTQEQAVAALEMTTKVYMDGKEVPFASLSEMEKSLVKQLAMEHMVAKAAYRLYQQSNIRFWMSVACNVLLLAAIWLAF